MFLRSEAQCTTCKADFTSLPGERCRYCKQGFYYDQWDVKCKLCSKLGDGVRADCSETTPNGNDILTHGPMSLATVPMLPGYWRTNENSSDLRRCPDASSPDTTACANNGANGTQICKPWTKGPFCRVCNVTDGSQYFDSVRSACVQCGDTAATPLAALVSITLAVLSVFCWCSVRQPCKRLRTLVYQILLKTRAPLKQIITFYQARVPAICAACPNSLHPTLD